MRFNLKDTVKHDLLRIPFFCTYQNRQMFSLTLKAKYVIFATRGGIFTTKVQFNIAVTVMGVVVFITSYRTKIIFIHELKQGSPTP